MFYITCCLIYIIPHASLRPMLGIYMSYQRSDFYFKHWTQTPGRFYVGYKKTVTYASYF